MIKQLIERIISNEKIVTAAKAGIGILISAAVGFCINLIFQDFKFVLIVGVVVIAIILLPLIIIAVASEAKFNLQKILKSNRKQKEWKEIIRLTYPLSRSLFLSGKHNLRVEFGNYAREACEKLLAGNKTAITINDSTEQINTILINLLIDDLGWSLYKTNQRYYANAETNIYLGIKMAIENENISKAIKGYRHLMHMAIGTCNDADFVTSRGKAYTLLNDMQYTNRTSKKAQQKDLAGLLHADLTHSIKKAESLPQDQRTPIIENAEQLLTKIIQIYEDNDADRYAKTFVLKAKIQFLKGGKENIILAEKDLIDGINYCQEQQRRESFVESSLLYLEIYLYKLNNFPKNKSQIDYESKNIKNIYQNAQAEIKELDSRVDCELRLKEVIKKMKRSAKRI